MNLTWPLVAATTMTVAIFRAQPPAACSSKTSASVAAPASAPLA